MSFFKKLFGGKKDNGSPIEDLVRTSAGEIIDKAGFDLSYDVRMEKDGENSVIYLNLSGADEEILKDRKGQVLDAFQLLIKRMIQHNFPDDRSSLNVDCGGYREETEAALIERAEHLKNLAIDQGKSVYYRALPPKERKIVHQYLAKDNRIKSKSLGEGLYKKIKIFPVRSSSQVEMADQGD